MPPRSAWRGGVIASHRRWHQRAADAAAVSEQELKQLVRARLSPFKVPREIEFVSELPHTEERDRLGLAEKAASRAVHAPEGDCRDWDGIDAFAGEIAAALSAAEACADRR